MGAETEATSGNLLGFRCAAAASANLNLKQESVCCGATGVTAVDVLGQTPRQKYTPKAATAVRKRRLRLKPLDRFVFELLILFVLSKILLKRFVRWKYAEPK